MSESLLRAVKIFVVVGGVLIVAGTATLIALLVKRGGTAVETRAIAATTPGSVSLPPGAEVTQASLADGNLLLLGRAPDGQFVLVVDPASGERRQLLWLKPGGP